MDESNVMIPLSEPSFSDTEWKYVQQAIVSGWVSSAGPKTEALESAVSNYTGAADVVAVNSGTAALHLSLLGAGVMPGDSVLVSDVSFIASANVVRYCNATPIFMDIDPVSWQADPELCNSWLQNNCVYQNGNTIHKASGSIIRAMILVHAFGFPAPAHAFELMLQGRNISLIEDAAGAMGTRLQGAHVGTFGRWGCISLNGNKIITAGSGGLILCKNASDATYLRHLSRQAKIPNSAYSHDLIGYNYRMPDICAALALAQFERLDDFIQKKQNIMNIYRNELGALQWQDYAQSDAPNAWLNVCKVPLRDTWIQTLHAHNISASEVWMPLHAQPQFKQAICIGNGNAARDLYTHALSIPGSVTLTLPQQMKIVKILRELISIAG